MRLLVLLRDTDARQALRETIHSLNRAQVDGRMDRYVHWSEEIAPKFNNASYRPHVSFDGHGLLAATDASRPPLQDRPCLVLKEDFNKLRPMFTLALSNWSKSGQDEVNNFLDFVRTGSEFNDIPKQLHIVVEIFRCGTPQQDYDLVDMIVRNLYNEKHNGYESSALMDDVEKALEEAPSYDEPLWPSSSGSQKRKPRQEELMEQQIKFHKQSVEGQTLVNNATIDVLTALKINDSCLYRCGCSCCTRANI